MSNQIFLSYLKKFRDMPINKIIRDYSEIEFYILKNLESSLNSILMQHKYKLGNDGIFVKDKIGYDIKWSVDSRTVIVRITNVIDERDSEKVYEEYIGQIGVIEKLVFIISRSFPLDAREIINSLKEQLIDAYQALECTFVENINDLDRAIFRELYHTLEALLNRRGKSHLFGKSWFFIAEKDVGFYFFDEKIIKKVFEHLKNNQHKTYSPLELTIW